MFDMTLEEEDAKDRRSDGRVFSTKGEEAPHQRTRANAGQAVKGPLAADR